MDLSDFFKTKSQADDFSTRLASITEGIYTTDFNLEKTLIDQFGMQKKDIFMTFLRNNKVNVTSNAEVKEFFEKIREQVSSIPTLSLTIAFAPQEETLKALSEWFLLNTKKQVLFNITVDTNLIAGATVIFNGKLVDFSIKSVFDQIFQDTLRNALTKTEPVETLSPASHQSIEHITFGR